MTSENSLNHSLKQLGGVPLRQRSNQPQALTYVNRSAISHEVNYATLILREITNEVFSKHGFASESTHALRCL